MYMHVYSGYRYIHVHRILSFLHFQNQNMTTDDLNADCSGRYHHSMVYDPCSQSLWLYGGRGLSSGCGLLDDVVAVSVISGGVRVVESEGVTPEGRYLHSAVLLRVSQVIFLPVRTCNVASYPGLLS